MKILLHWCRWWSRFCLRSVCLSLNLVLTLSALLLGFILWMQTQNKVWVLPDWAGQKLRALIREQGLEVDFRDLIFDASGYIVLRDVELRQPGSGEVFLRIPRLHTRLDLGSLCCGQLRLEFVECFNLQIPHPRIVPTQSESPLLEQGSVRLENTGAWWVLKHGQARTKFGTINFRGDFGFPPASKAQPSSSRARLLEHWLPAWVEAALFLEQHASLLASLQNPCWEIDIHQTNPLTFSLDVEIWIGGWRSERVSSGPGLMRCRLEYEEKHFNHPLIEVHWRDLHYREIHLARLETVLPGLPLNFAHLDWPAELRLYLSGLQWGQDYFPGLALSLFLPGSPSPDSGPSRDEWSRLLAHPWQVSTALYWLGQPISAQVYWDANNRMGRAKLDGWLDFPWFLERWGTRFPAASYLQTEQPLQFQLTGEFTEQGLPRSLTGSVWLDQSIIAGIPVNHAELHGSWQPSELKIHEAEFYHPQHHLRGSYEENLETRDFRFLVLGRAYPPNLNPLFDDWWDRLWTKLVMTGPDLIADVDYHSRWGDPLKGEIHAWGQARQFQLHGLPVTNCSLRLRRKMGFVQLQDLSALCPEGQIDGSICWLYPYLTKSEETQTQFDLRSTLPLSELQKVVSSLAPVTPLFSNTSRPLLRARGYFAEIGHHLTAQRIDLEATIAGEFRFHSLPFHGLQLNARLRGHSVYLDRIETKFCEGLLSANADLDPAPPGQGRPIRLQCQLLEAAYPEAWQEFQHFLQQNSMSTIAPRSMPPPPNPSKTSTSPAPGRLGLAAFLHGNLGDMKSLVGEGSVWIRQPELGRIRIFGLLSKVLESLGSGFATLSLSDVNGNFSLTPQHLQLPDLKITGPSATIDAVGQITRRTGELNFSVNLYLPNVFIFNPLSYVLSMRLRGTVDDPQWSLAIDPRNWFRTQNDHKSLPSP